SAGLRRGGPVPAVGPQPLPGRTLTAVHCGLYAADVAPWTLRRDHEPIVMIAPIMGVQLHDRFLVGVPPSGSGADPPGDLAAVRPHPPALTLRHSPFGTQLPARSARRTAAANGRWANAAWSSRVDRRPHRCAVSSAVG